MSTTQYEPDNKEIMNKSLQKKADSLATRIDKFLEKYGKRDPEGEWNGPDQIHFVLAAGQLRSGMLPQVPCSEWGQGGYSMTDASRREHDAIIGAVRELRVQMQALVRAGIMIQEAHEVKP